MEHMILKAVTTAQDQGIFTAVISASSVDREKDVVDPAGMVAALQKWVPTGKQIPLAWNHSTSADQIIGSIDPASARNVDGEVVVTGQIDQSTETGSHAWRLIKSGVVGFSFGYLILKGSNRKGGGRNIMELDVFEITATPTPMNNDTRVLDYKADVADLRRRADAVELEHALSGLDEKAMATGRPLQILNAMISQAQEYIDNAPDSEDADEMRSILDDLKELVSDVDDAADQAEDAGEGKRLREIYAAYKAVWTTAYVNNLPDSAFLYIEPGGKKDSEGKTTPRSLRHFPVRDDSGAVDQAHVRNALSRIPQSNLSQAVKDAATAKAQRLLDGSKSVDEADKERKSARSVDPLRIRADAVALEFASDGESLRKPPRPHKTAPPDLLPMKELKRRMREQMLTALSGGIDDE